MHKIKGIPPGPWRWRGDAAEKEISLYSPASSRKIMSFARWGMTLAQPVFTSVETGKPVPAADLLKFWVGDKKVTGLSQARTDKSVSRYDISGIDHPVARLIEYAEPLLSTLATLLAHDCHGGDGNDEEYVKARDCALTIMQEIEG